MKNINLRELPKAIWIALAILGVNAAAFGFGILPLEQKIESEISATNQLERRVRQLRSQAQSIRRDVSDVTALQDEYNSVMATAFAKPQNRLDAIKQLDALRSEFHVSKLSYRFDEEYIEQVDQVGAVSQEFELVFTPVVLESSAMLDSDLLGFWGGVLRNLPARYKMKNLTVTRSGELDREVINQLRVGQTTDLVNGKIEFEWISLRKRKPAPSAPPAARTKPSQPTTPAARRAN